MDLKPFWLINQSEQALLSRKLTRGITAWCDEWAHEAFPCSVRLLDDPAAILSDRYLWQSGRTSLKDVPIRVAVGTPRDANWGLRFLISGTPNDTEVPHGELLPELERSVLQSLVESILQETGARTDTALWERGLHAPETLCEHGCVAAECQIPGAHAGIAVILYPETTKAYLEGARPTTPKLSPVSLRNVIASQSICVDVVAGEAELSLEEVVGLRIGDVLKLDRTIDRPLSVTVDGAEAVAVGHLGLRGSSRAIKVSCAT